MSQQGERFRRQIGARWHMPFGRGGEAPVGACEPGSAVIEVKILAVTDEHERQHVQSDMIAQQATASYVSTNYESCARKR
jgi:hypothetical protein